MTTQTKIEAKTLALLIKWGNNPDEAAKMVKANFEFVFSCCPDAKASYFAEFIATIS